MKFAISEVLSFSYYSQCGLSDEEAVLRTGEWVPAHAASWFFERRPRRAIFLKTRDASRGFSFFGRLAAFSPTGIWQQSKFRSGRQRDTAESLAIRKKARSMERAFPEIRSTNSPAVINRLAAGLVFHALVVDRHRAAVRVHRRLTILRNGTQAVRGTRGRAVKCHLIVIGDVLTSLAWRQGHSRPANHGLVVTQVGRVEPLHELLHFQQAAFGCFPPGLDHVILIGRIRDRSEDRDDQYDDDDLDQREALGTARRHGCM